MEFTEIKKYEEGKEEQEYGHYDENANCDYTGVTCWLVKPVLSASKGTHTSSSTWVLSQAL